MKQSFVLLFLMYLIYVLGICSMLLQGDSRTKDLKNKVDSANIALIKLEEQRCITQEKLDNCQNTINDLYKQAISWEYYRRGLKITDFDSPNPK